jgi:hypothetical protein
LQKEHSSSWQSLGKHLFLSVSFPGKEVPWRLLFSLIWGFVKYYLSKL